jgi:hypothetical protein
MKKFLSILVVVILLLVVILAAVPLLFKNRIIQFVKDTANENLTATLNFSDVDISLIKNFPRATVILKNVSVVNAAPFLGDTLFSAKEIDFTAEPIAYVREGVVKLLALHLDEPRIYTHVLSDSLKNWRITKSSTKAASNKDTASMSLALKNYSIKNGAFRFRSEAADREFVLENINHEGSGDFANDVFTLITRTDALTSFRQRGAAYMNAVKTTLTAQIGVDLKKNVYTFKENELTMNDLHAGFEGSLGLPDDRDDIDLDLKFATRNADFKAFLSMVPAMYSAKFQDLKASGSADVQGFVRGAYNDAGYPAFDVRATVQNGMADHPKLPAALKAVMLDFQAQNPGGSLDNTIVTIRQLSLLLAGNPFDMTLEVRTPMSDPNVTASVKGRINVANVKQLVESAQLNKIQSGVAAMDVAFRGKMSSVKNKEYQNLSLSGKASVEGFEYASDSLPEKVTIPSATLSFSPQKATLSNCRVNLGKSDLALEGQLENVIGYALYDDLLKGSLRLTSTYFDVNPWMKSDSAKKPASGTKSDTAVSSVELPANIDFTMQAAMKRVIFSNLDMQDAQGTMTLREKVLRFENLGVKLLGAKMLASGSYNTQNPLQPKTDFNLQLTDVGIKALYEKFVTVQEFVPFAQYLQGNIALKVKLATDLDGKLKPVWSTFLSDGGINIALLKLEDFKPINAIADALKFDPLRNPTLSKINAFYEIKDGRFYLKPFKTKIAGMDVSIEGSNGLDKSIDYTVNLVLPGDKLTGSAFDALGSIGGVNLAALKPKTIPVTVHITGTLENPIIQPSLQGVQNAGQQILDAAQEEAKRRAEEEIQKAQQKLKDEADKRTKELEDKAKQEADRKAKELEQKAKDELKKRLPFDMFGGKKDTTKK